MKLELIEEVKEVRIGQYHYEHPDGDAGENRLYASIDGANWGEITSYAPVHHVGGFVSAINVVWTGRGAPTP